MEPERLGKYEIQGTLGKGAMGTVYAGWDPIISRKVAIKTVRLPDAADIEAQEELARFKREAQAAGRLTHPNIVGIFDYGETDELAYIVMEFVDGHTLKGLLDAGERMALPNIGRIMTDVLGGLQYSHDRGVVHRDIKPANIMVVGGEGDGRGQAKIADFGIARIESSNLTQAGTIMGTPAYMSPEQFMGQTVDARTDIYSSGVLLFQLLTGERPFEGSMATIMHKALNTQPPKPSDLSVTAPAALDPVVARAMARRPEDRFETASIFAEALKAGLQQKALPLGFDDPDNEATIVAPPRPVPITPRPAPSTLSPAPTRSKAPALVAAAVIALAAAGGGAWFALSGSTPPPAASPPLAQADSTALVAVAPPSAEPPANVATRRPLPPEATTLAPNAAAEPQPPAPSGPTTSPALAKVTPPSTERNRLVAGMTLEPAEIAAPTLAGAAPARIAQPVQGADASVSPPAPLSPPPEPATVAAVVGPAVTAPPATAPKVSAPIASAPIASAPVIAAAGVSPEALRRAVASAVRGADCAIVHGDLSRSGTLSLRGVIGAGSPVQALLGEIRAAAPDANLEWTAQEASGPYCGALNLIHGLARPFGATSGGMDVGLKDGRTRLVADDKIDIRTTLPAFASYLQIDYFSSDGSVAHLRTAAQGGAATPAGSTDSFVAGEAAPPFGADLIVAIASSAPLFAKGQALPDTAEPYLRELRQALDAAKLRNAELAAAAVVVRTSPKS